MQGAAYVEVIAFCPNCRARMDENRESIHAKLTIAKEGNIEGPKIPDENPFRRASRILVYGPG